MTELSFATSFLNSLGSLPTKLPPDHVEDPHSYPAKGAYILPKMPRPLAKRQKLAPGQERSLTIHLKSLRNPKIDITLQSQSLLTSILDLKTQVSSQASIPVDRIRILYQKKPVGDTKVLKDLVMNDVSIMDLSIMVLGGAGSVNINDATAASPTSRESGGVQALATQEFWHGLKGFLAQRLENKEDGERVYDVFRKAWDATGSHSSPRVP